ncbi:ATP-binding region, ATPase-like:Histidine kinase, HAMP region:Histidine kinase A [Pseudomonas syringae pv. solidagae]|uniref:histidine kinase n=1 Tax=Pseudomonas syringae pv. solidagae TaxID=264458 RepID=A0A3M5LYM9_PSESX|nr:ATP-binding region, ATPase-like:Histidine kinase, HAMP region:Histidine kinase A [Pseudomonas syringae pv. solidagae]
MARPAVRPGKRRGPRARRAVARQGRPRACAGQVSDAIVWRHATATGHRPGTDHETARPAAGRAVRRARPRHPQGHAPPAAGPVARNETDRVHGYPRPVRRFQPRHPPAGFRQGAPRPACARSLWRTHHLRHPPQQRTPRRARRYRFAAQRFRGACSMTDSTTLYPVFAEELLPGGGHRSFILKRGELLRLTDSLNRLLRSEREQRIRYRDSLDDLAHSLKTPLAVLQGVSENIAKRPEDVEQAWVLQSQIERMSQQIGYQLQRASLRKSGLVRHHVMLRPVVESLCNTLDKVYRDKQVKATLDLPEHCQVHMEEGALLEMLGNLLENAYRLCLSEVRVSFTRSTTGDELCVEDDGPGVPQSQRARILERGERLDRQNPGQGIGLAVVKDIIESYGAQLTLGDSPLGGAAFRIHFLAQ